MDYSKTAAGVLEGVGGEENVTSLVHCATRLRFVLKDESKANGAQIKAVPGVVTVAQAGGQYQVVIGNEVPEVFAEIGKISKFGGGQDTTGAAASGPKGNLFNRFITMISALFTPLLWPLAAVGLLKAFLIASTTFGWLDGESSTHVVLDALSDAFIYFLPIALAITAARYFKAQEFTSLAIAGALVYPSIAGLVGAEGLTFFGIPFTVVNYASSVIPVIVIVWIQGHLERVLYRTLPAMVRRFLTPLLALLLLVPFTLLAIGPLSGVISDWLATGVSWAFDVAPWLGGAILGGLWQFFVMFGLHWGFIPLINIEIAEAGRSFIIAPLFAAVFAQAAAAAGVWVRARSRRLKALAGPATISGFVAGVTEPAIYGVNLPLKRPFAFGIVGGVIGGAIISAAGSATSAFTFMSALSIPALTAHGNFAVALIGMAVAIVVAFGLTVIFGFTEPKEDAETAAAAPTTSANDVVVLSPVDGTVVPLSETPDAAFAEGSLGDGVAIKPRSGAVYAPFDAVVAAAFPTGHAIGLRHADGAEVLIHIGIDTVKLAGEHFDVKVTTGQQVKAGDLLVEFDGDAIERAGYDLTTPVIITNGELYPGIADAASGPLAHGEPLFVARSVESAVAAK